MIFNVFKYYTAVIFLILWSNPIEKNITCEITHVVNVKHPGISLTDSVQRKLIHSRCEIKKADVFYMDVESVVCGDIQCRIDIVRIYWDELGNYQRITLAPGVELEKAEGATFTRTDYQKLDKILSNRKSSLRDVYKEEVTGNETSEGIDALSGATIILDTDSYVKGAVWTCYTLWHWANGDINPIIRDITGDSKTPSELQGYLFSEDMAYKIFALEQLIRRKNYELRTIELILQQAETNNYNLQKLIVAYVEEAQNDLYFSMTEKLLGVQRENIQLLALESLSKTNKVPQKEFYDRVSKYLSNWDSYQTIDRFFNLLDKKDVHTPNVVEHIIPLLNHDDFIRARRGYWFLANQELSNLDKRKVDIFYNKNKDRL